MKSRPISGDLYQLQKEIQSYADEYGLNYFEQIFEVCDYDTVNILAAQGGFPVRYPHWRHGMSYDQMSQGYRFGLQKIYEMVINTDPCYAYLLEVNNWLDQKLVMAHVYGHNDFFKNNAWFSKTNRKMMDVMANNATKIRRYQDRYGIDEVEAFIDRVLSLENLIDQNELFEDFSSKEKREELENQAKKEREENDGYFFDDRSQALKSFMRSQLKSEQMKLEKNDNKTSKKDQEDSDIPQSAEKNTIRGERDILRFLMNHAPLEEWQVDIIGILRAEAYYFLPQRMTKIMNEGWASYWHSTIMNNRAMNSNEFVDFADKHAGVMVMQKQQINPYKIGIEMMRDIEYRWDTGRFGKDYVECDNLYDKENWHRPTHQGREKIFQVRKVYNDLTFIDEYFTPEFCERQKLFTYKYNPRTQRMEIDSRDFKAIKQKLLQSLTNFGEPLIFVDDANFKNAKELLLKHRHDGVDLDVGQAHMTMKNMFYLWKRPVHLATRYQDKEVLLSFDGKTFSQK